MKTAEEVEHAHDVIVQFMELLHGGAFQYIRVEDDEIAAVNGVGLAMCFVLQHDRGMREIANLVRRLEDAIIAHEVAMNGRKNE